MADAMSMFCGRCQTLSDEICVKGKSLVTQCAVCGQETELPGTADEQGLIFVGSEERTLTPFTKEEDDSIADFKRATVEEECPKCAHPEMLFYTLQLRSVDEGQTVFYECPKCGFTDSTNT